jgi:Sec-independent protein translocase protein TatA
MNKYVSIAVLWAACAVPAFAGCNKPSSPGAFPDGKTAAMEVMMAAKKEMDTFKKDMEQYITCERIAAKQNDAQAELERVAEAFNVQVRAFKAKG